MIDLISQATPEKRVEILQGRYEKNLAFFKQNHPDLHELLIKVQSPYEINLTETFLDVVDTKTGASCLTGDPVAYAKALGDWSHQAWSEMIDLKLRTHPERFQHSQMVRSFSQGLLDAFPQFGDRFKQLRVDLPTLKDGRKFSNPVVFIGLLHGLHIDYFLSRTEVRTVAFIEPDPNKFVVSSYFLDYQDLHERLGPLLIQVGTAPEPDFMDVFFMRAFVTGNVWVRALFGYASEENGNYLQQLTHHWQALQDNWFPADTYLDAMGWCLENLKAKRPVLNARPQLSEHSQIAVVGAGPSLTDDLPWLKENRENLIIFAAHSAIRPLKKAGIEPDFQFCLDLDLQGEAFEGHDFYPDIPIIVDSRTSPTFLSFFSKPLLLAGRRVCYPVRFEPLVEGIMPTTGNLCVAFACFCQPEKLYLFGMDLGFKQVQQSHADGTIYDDKAGEHEKVAGEKQLVVPANFTESGRVLTRPYFNLARCEIEELLRAETGRTEVFNCSDGAGIKGAQPHRSGSARIAGNPVKSVDLSHIENCFSAACSGVGYRAFRQSGAKSLHNIRERLLSLFVEVDVFDWIDFTRKLDRSLMELLVESTSDECHDRRMQGYLDIVRDLFVAWYRFLCFAQSEEESLYLYDVGRRLLEEALAELTWPLECDDY